MKSNQTNESDGDTYRGWNLSNNSLWRRGFGNQRKNQDHPDYSTIKIIKDTLKNSGDLISLSFFLQWHINLHGILLYSGSYHMISGIAEV